MPEKNEKKTARVRGVSLVGGKVELWKKGFVEMMMMCNHGVWCRLSLIYGLL